MAVPFEVVAGNGGIDCDAPGSGVERSICRIPALTRRDADLQALSLKALQRSDDAAAFEADARHWRNEKLGACTTDRCIEISYDARMASMRALIDIGAPPLLMPGDYGRQEGGGASLAIAFLGQQRYALQLMATPGATSTTQGEFAEHAGAATFTADGCTLGMSFAFDVLLVSGATPGCGAAVDGTYRRIAPEP